MPRQSERTAYCHRQAAECAKAALETTIADLKEAYVNLEQGWLHLAPELTENPKPTSRIEPTEGSIGSMPARSRSRSVRHRR
jgi:hypothetical protein